MIESFKDTMAAIFVSVCGLCVVLLVLYVTCLTVGIIAGMFILVSIAVVLFGLFWSMDRLTQKKKE